MIRNVKVSLRDADDGYYYAKDKSSASIDYYGDDVPTSILK